MRKNRENQLPLSPSWPDHRLARELEVISKILDQNPSISDLVLHDLCDKVSSKNGARGMTAEQVLRCALIKQTHQFSYEKLSFHLADSQSFRAFCRLPYGFTPRKSALQENISKIQDSSWQEMNRVLVGWADQEGLEKGRKIRVDATGVESNIHYPRDSQLLVDAIRVLTRLLKRLSRRESVTFVDHCRRAKRRCLNILKQPRTKAKEALSGSPEGGTQHPQLCPKGAGASRGLAGSDQPGAGSGPRSLSETAGTGHPADGAARPAGGKGARRREGGLHL